MRSVLLDDPTLAEGTRRAEAPPLLAPLVTPPLTPDQAVGVDLILEGFLAHHGTPRQLDPVAVDGMRVLAGDYCYAAGLVAVAAAGDLFVIHALGELVARSAGLVAAGRHGSLPVLWLGVVGALRGPRDPQARAELHRALAALHDGDDAPLRLLAAAVPGAPDLEAVFE